MARKTALSFHLAEMTVAELKQLLELAGQDLDNQVAREKIQKEINLKKTEDLDDPY